ncbi:NCBP3 domain-containing protein [Aspergillus undulatus]|uniref:NCBP3 domain-containing protein n=1 Tax=Aspergillus undulatus TaxID=1810928 RepID=UPI003CCCAF65
MDATMDIDMDLDLGPLPEPEPIEMEQTLQATTAPAADGSIVDPQTAEMQSEKVHIRGVDDLTTDNIKEFASAHFTLEPPSRIEWIDDTSANIVYSSPEVGLQALAALTHDSEAEAANGVGETATLTAPGEVPALRLRSAKILSSHPDSVLQVRSAVKADKKKPRAYEASRFYMMHPEHDPRERLRRELATDRRRGGGDSDGDYRRRRFDGRELRRRREQDYEEGITANMYDDTGAGSADRDDRDWDRGRRRRGSGSGRGRYDRARDLELFPEEGARSGRLRNRSASPGRDTLMQEGGYINERQESRRRFRERSSPAHRRNEGRELFVSSDDTTLRELFPNKTANTYLKRELFPSKVSNHRRSDAIDAADETADLFARRISNPLVDGAQDTNSSRNRNVELFPESSSSNSRGGVNIRGSASNRQDQGFAIRGAAENGISIKGRGGASVRELFPSKFAGGGGSNAGKELFSDKIEGRGGPRRRAEDMFT